MIERIAEYDLGAADEAQISAVIAESFPTDFGGRSFFQQRPHLRVVWRDREIVAQISLFYRSIRLDETLATIVGIGDVACSSKYRGQGIGTQLLAASLETARSSQAEFAVLFGARGLYDQAGFLPQKNPYTCLDLTGAKTLGLADRNASCLMVKPLSVRPWPAHAKVDFLGPLF